MASITSVEHASALARIDPSAVTESGVWVAPLLPPGSFEGYQAEAILPDESAGGWIQGAAVEPLLADATTPAPAVVELIHRVPGALEKAMHDYPRDSIGPDNRGEREFAEVETATLEAAAEEIGGILLDVALAQPGDLTTTVTPLKGEFAYPGLKVGFHLDNRDQQPLATRTDSRRRLIASRGPGVRMAAFCLPDIVTVGYILGCPDDLVPSYDIYREYLRKYPRGAICVAIPVMPGQASLINTDLYVHDGMMVGATREAMTFQVLGNWDRGALTRTT